MVKDVEVLVAGEATGEAKNFTSVLADVWPVLAEIEQWLKCG